ncbi:hypothetical protein [Limosilactobacillus antri]|uniref:Uncharacterized protein n=1 Tax=Limosilactobacillus antri DSM 16041 TaxID=525309 RepID=C8P7U6_9LACO|nr:hypothetical protein [Limosilactobacillus antri]EEW53455.1 hypothetical protein HMPREF0494_1390 [Limosilactobacillus antri DSM 16041]KRK60580.1 hypothetical protein FC31_GL001194 [Limosilactobacillus antri DSM 16041]
MNNNKLINSPQGRLTTLSASFKDVLKMGQRYVQLLDQLAETTDAKEMLAATTQLAELDLQNDLVDFPRHYQAADYYLIFMGRLLEKHGIDAVQITENSQRQFIARIEPIADSDSFKFQINEDGEAAFTEQGEQEPLFYLDLANRFFQFNNQALVNYFIVRALKKHTDLELRDAVKPLIAFAQELAADLDFTINLGILNTDNAERFALARPDLDLTVIDRLFVATAENDYMLMNLPHNNGAELVLDQGIKLDIAFDPDDYSQQWFFAVQDPESRVSFFDTLLHYNLIRQWYLNNRDELAVRSDKLVVATAAAAESFDQPTEVFQPNGEQAVEEDGDPDDHE